MVRSDTRDGTHELGVFFFFITSFLIFINNLLLSLEGSISHNRTVALAITTGIS